MTYSAFLLFIAVAVWVSFLVVRRRFLPAMVDASLADLAVLAWEVEKLAAAGEVARESAFYRYYHDASLELAHVDADWMPGLPSVVLMALGRHARLEPAEDLVKAARAEVAGRYRKHGRIARRHAGAVVNAWKYRSLVVWALLKAFLGPAAVVMAFAILFVSSMPRQHDGRGVRGALAS